MKVDNAESVLLQIREGARSMSVEELMALRAKVKGYRFEAAHVDVDDEIIRETKTVLVNQTEKLTEELVQEEVEARQRAGAVLPVPPASGQSGEGELELSQLQFKITSLSKKMDNVDRKLDTRDTAEEYKQLKEICKMGDISVRKIGEWMVGSAGHRH